MTIKLFQVQTTIVEGLTNNDSKTSDSSVSSNSGVAGLAASYASTIKSLTVKLQDELLISKYRKEYESIIINLDDYTGYLMIQQLLNIKPNSDLKTKIEALNNLNTLKNAKDSLNSAMIFLDKQ